MGRLIVFIILANHIISFCHTKNKRTKLTRVGKFESSVLLMLMDYFIKFIVNLSISSVAMV